MLLLKHKLENILVLLVTSVLTLHVGCKVYFAEWDLSLPENFHQGWYTRKVYQNLKMRAVNKYFSFTLYKC